jgi:hypothetical protein
MCRHGTRLLIHKNRGPATFDLGLFWRTQRNDLSISSSHGANRKSFEMWRIAGIACCALRTLLYGVGAADPVVAARSELFA